MSDADTINVLLESKKNLEPDSQNEYEHQDDASVFIINQAQINAIIDHIKRLLGLDTFEISVDFVSSDEIKQLNSQYRNKDSSTDVLSFPQQTWLRSITTDAPYTPDAIDPVADIQALDKMPVVLLGDIVISLNDAQSNASSIGHGLDREVAFLLTHSVLHLCGHDHQEPEQEHVMLEQQRSIIDHLSGAACLFHAGEHPFWFNCVRVKT